LPVLAVLLGLGFWQIHRLHWKLALIAEVSETMKAAPISLSQVLALPPDSAQYRRVVLEGHFDNAKEAYAYMLDAEGAPVYHVLTPLILGDGRAVIVDRGKIPQNLRDPKTREAGELRGEQRVVGIWRKPDPPNFVTPSPDLAKRIWFSRDVAAIARADGVTLVAPVIVEADATPAPGGWPKGGQTVVTFPNHHLQYAVTWFGLAWALILIYFSYHVSKGRLGWKGRGV
jgi:surfeit locus 1 family protein